LPHFAQEIHHEVELALKFSSHLHVVEAAVALDLTDRPVQEKAKQQGQPWTLAKSFHNACAVSSFFSVKNLSELADLEISLWLNDELRQQGRTSEMIFGFDQLLEFVKEHFPVCPGDLLLTGTPQGVGSVRHGDVLKARIEGQITHTWKVLQEPKPAPKSP
jgi:2-keto-4-pentenoate hydratase/2-oxohepta-3-ene-1,7-dioic acid hydratase in catechol pathway